jgi:uncharacterized membrane protein
VAITLALSFLIGLLGGLRSLTAPAATAWAIRLGWLQPPAALAFAGSAAAVGVLTAAAIAELVVDKLPQAPNRTEWLGLGAATGACVAASGGAATAVGALLGAAGGVAGCYGGYLARTRLAAALGRDLPVAVAEDALAIAGSLWVVTRL